MVIGVLSPLRRGTTASTVVVLVVENLPPFSLVLQDSSHLSQIKPNTARVIRSSDAKSPFAAGSIVYFAIVGWGKSMHEVIV